MLLKGSLKNGLYVFAQSQINILNIPKQQLPQSLHQPESEVHNASVNIVSSSSNNVQTFSCSTFELRHNRLGHPSEKIVKSVLNQCNIPYINKEQSSFCPACCLGKIHRLPFTKSETVYSSPLQFGSY